MVLDYPALGKRIKAFRKEAGLSQALLAEFIDVSPQYISHIETGRKKASLEIIVRIANVLNLSLDRLVSDNLYHTQQAYYEFLGDLLLDCRPEERKVLLDVMSTLQKKLKREPEQKIAGICYNPHMIITMVLQAALWICSLGCIITYSTGQRTMDKGTRVAGIIMLCLYSAALAFYYLNKPKGKWVLLGVLVLWFIIQIVLAVRNKAVPYLYHISLMVLIIANVIILYLFGFWDITMPRFKYTQASSHEVAGRQGICTEDGYYWVSGSATLTKYDSDWNVVAENTEPLQRYKYKVNHIGDIDVYQNDLYLGVELFTDDGAENIQVAVYDGDTLERKYVFPLNLDSGQAECSGIAIDPDSMTVYLSAWGDDEASSCLYMYDLGTGDYKGTLQIDPVPKWIQGVAYYDGNLYVTCDEGDAESGEPDTMYRLDVDKEGSTAVAVLERSFDDVKEQGEMEGLNFDKDNGQLLILYNRGAVIRDGHISGFYPGYDHEVHEVYLFDCKDQRNK